VTKVETPHFTMYLPDGWEERANAEGVEWVAPDGAQQVIVSVVLAKRGADIQQALESLMTIRREQFAKLAGAAGQLVPLGIQAADESWIGKMVGADAAHHVMTFVRIVATPVRIVTASVFQYGTLENPTEFAARAEEICSTLAVSRESAQQGWRRFIPW
jgi:hypothetical protein